MPTAISKLVLNNFRNFSSKKLEFNANQILFCGANGIGKTNILEAISLIGRSPSLRGDEYDEMLKKDALNFSIYCELKNHNFLEKIAVKFDKNSKKKSYEFNGEPSGSKRQTDLKNYLINFNR